METFGNSVSVATAATRYHRPWGDRPYAPWAVTVQGQVACMGSLAAIAVQKSKTLSPRRVMRRHAGRDTEFYKRVKLPLKSTGMVSGYDSHVAWRRA